MTDKPTKIYAEHVEPSAMEQFNGAMAQPFAVKGALMPDAHTGFELCIGGVVATRDVVVPGWVGVDIGCGLCALPTDLSADEVRSKAKEIFDEIYRAIPVGFNHNQKPSEWAFEEEIPRTNRMQEIFDKNGLFQLGSLGGGNHFLEIGADENDRVWVVIHSGSRGIGHTTATHYMRLAKMLNEPKEAHFGLDVNSAYGKDYITDLGFCLQFALENRAQMLRRIDLILMTTCQSGKGGQWSGLINRNHNHAELKDGLWIHRKGATHAELGMMGVIPGNMRDGSFIVRGKGNPDALWSSSHGAGRVMGRKQAERTLDMDSFKSTMAGIVAKVGPDTLDESPMAYKDIHEVMRLQADLVDVVHHVKPILNIKGVKSHG